MKKIVITAKSKCPETDRDSRCSCSIHNQDKDDSKNKTDKIKPALRNKVVNRKDFRQDGFSADDFDRMVQNFYKREEEDDRRLDDKWEDMLRRQKNRREPAMARSKKIIIEAKRKKG